MGIVDDVVINVNVDVAVANTVNYFNVIKQCINRT